jgi:cellulose synthase/poly-beta-1,6-N-acetylglucosamine synthase-like glycosyltransferase
VDSEKTGKGYVIDFLLDRIDEDFGKDSFDAFVVFDADNTVDEEYFTEVNKAFSSGYDVVTCYRNSKNYADNWLTAGSGLWFIRESRYLNGSRMRIGACPQVSGTGFLFSNSLKNELGGWPYHTLTEDYEFTCDSVIKGRKFAYCEDAVFYDEQTSSLRQSFNQRLRWCKGGIQSFKKYGKGLFKTLFSGNFVAAYDMLMSVAPAYIISVLATLLNLGFAPWMIAFGDISVLEAFAPALAMTVGAYLVLLPHSIVPTVTEWHRIKAKNYQKIIYMFTFPLYMVTFIPACIVALFKKNVAWKKIDHGNKKDRE